MRRSFSTRAALLLGALTLSACGLASQTSDPSPSPVAVAQPSDAPTNGPASTAPPAPTSVPAPSALPAPTATPGTPAPELLGGQEWINSEPLTLAELRGKVVLIDFWTYGCYNCRNTLPAMRGWWQQYKDQGLVIIGVHSPEFSSEAVLENVQQATRELEVSWPVVQDNDMKIWRAYQNHYWPHFYLIDKQGNIVYDHIGEGRYDETERQIQAALAQ